jgi:hypothetical protein
MPNVLAQIENQLYRIKTLIPQGEDSQDYLRHTLDTHIASLSADTPMGVVPTSLFSETQVYASARMTVEMLDQPEQLASRPEGIVDLGVIEWLLRPALPLVDDQFKPPASGPWKHLESGLVQGIARSVCRLDLSIQGYAPIHVGTGFVVGEDAEDRFVIMTNKHVVDGAQKQGWTKWNEVKFACDFGRFSTDLGASLLSLDDTYDVHPLYDLAFVYLPKTNVNDFAPTPLSIASNITEDVHDLLIGVIGHPSFDARLDSFPKYFGFGNEFGIKRFSPGYIKFIENRYWLEHYVDVFLHDASTLSGSSGSCVFDLNTMQVVGLHFGGWPLQSRTVVIEDHQLAAQLFSANGAVPLWTLVDDPFLGSVSFA